MLQRAAGDSKHEVKLYTAQFPTDRHLVPDGLIPTPDLDRTLKDVSGIEEGKHLPLLADVLTRAAEISNAAFIVYSNMDIVPVPWFYNSVAALLDLHKCDALIVNRRRVDESLIASPDLLFAEAGLPHPGYDCFILRRELVPRLMLGAVAVGAPGVGFMLAHNLFLVANKCVVEADKHLTVHAGFDIIQKWKGERVAQHQKKEIRKFIDAHSRSFTIEKFPGYNYPFFRRHFRWLMNPLFHYPMMFKMDMKKLFDGREIRKPVKKDTRWQEWKSNRINFD